MLLHARSLRHALRRTECAGNHKGKVRASLMPTMQGWEIHPETLPQYEKLEGRSDYKIDNNFDERRVRSVAMLRKTQNHVSTHKSAEASCILRSLMETCKLWKVSVCEYLNKIYTAFSVGRTDYDNLMPWCLPYLS